MAAFDDAKALVEECEQILPEIHRLYQESIQSNELKTAVCIKVKTFVEHLRSALDYCAYAIYKKYGKGKPSFKPYFPYAKMKDTKSDFRSEIMERNLAGVAAARPDLVDLLEGYQYFGNTGNWLPILMELSNEHKHREFTPQAKKKYTMVNMSITLPPSGHFTLDLTSIKIGNDPEKGYKAEAYELTTYEFVTTGTIAYGLFEGFLLNVKSIVEKLSKVS